MGELKSCTEVERWGMLELAFPGRTEGNPFASGLIRATFTSRGERRTVSGFYDGGGIYRVRFMPCFEGEYEYAVSGGFSDREYRGRFRVAPASPGNHGPVRVSDQYHFAYADGTPHRSFGTTCYAWAMQPDAQIAQTLETLRRAPFNKLRFCVFPKHYDYNLREPRSYPFAGTPMDSSVLTPENFGRYDGTAAGNDWDFACFNPEHFRNLERCISALMELGIEADLILFHPYDRWGFSRMTLAQDLNYLRYAVARFAAYRNVWWAMANEYDLMPWKDAGHWEKLADALVAEDPYGHLRSIHNCHAFYDHTRPWITHASIQRQDLYRTTEYVSDWRAQFGKPIVCDEIAYEGDIQFGWGNISPEELVRRFWEAALRGGYAGHGETYLHESGLLWWSHGGVLRGESPERIGFLRRIVEDAPGPLRPWPGKFDETVAVTESPSAFEGGTQPYYLYYYGFNRPSFRDLYIDDETAFQADVIDTWNMTVTGAGIRRGRFRIELPARPYMAIRLRRS